MTSLPAKITSSPCFDAPPLAEQAAPPTGVFVGRKWPRGKQFEGGQIAYSQTRHARPRENQSADNDCGSGRGVVSADHPGGEVGGVIEHSSSGRRRAWERPLEETPSGAAKPAKDEDRIAPFHGVFLRRVSRPLGVCVRGLVRSLPAGINWTIATPKGGVQGMEHGLEHDPPHACRTSGKKGGVAIVLLVPAGSSRAGRLPLPSDCPAAR